MRLSSARATSRSSPVLRASRSASSQMPAMEARERRWEHGVDEEDEGGLVGGNEETRVEENERASWNGREGRGV